MIPRCKLLLINHFFHPDQSALSEIVTDLVKGLDNRHYDITVLCSKNLQTTIDRVPIIDFKNVKLRNITGSNFGKGTNTGRMIDFVSFYFFLFIKLLFIDSHDIVITTTAPPLVGIFGVLLKKIRKFSFIYIIQDLYPRTAIQLGVVKNRVLINKLEYVLKLIIKNADMNVVIGDDMKERIKAICTNSKLTTIQNWYTNENSTQGNFSLRSTYGINEKFIVLYSGNYGLAHDFGTFLESAKCLQKVQDILFVFIGEGKNKTIIESFTNENKLTNILLLPFQPKEYLSIIYSEANVGLVSLTQGLEGCIVPSKLYGLMSVGIPIIFVGSEDSEVSKTILQAECGYTVMQNDISSFVSNIYSLYSNVNLCNQMTINARRFYIKNFSRENAIIKYDHLLQNMFSYKGLNETPHLRRHSA